MYAKRSYRNDIQHGWFSFFFLLNMAAVYVVQSFHHPLNFRIFSILFQLG
jgi:hypothetical protein